MGAFVGFVVYVLIQGGLLALSQPSPNQTSSIPDINIYNYTIAIGLGWLAGYNVTEIISRLEKVATSLFGLEHEETPFERLKRLVHSRGLKEGRGKEQS